MISPTTSMPFVAGEHLIRKVEVLTSAPTPASGNDAVASRVSAGVARGDEEAFLELYDLYQARVFRLALTLNGRDETLAGEIVQTVMLTAAAKLKAVQSEAHLWNWLARVTRQKLTKTRRGAKREVPTTTVAELPDSPDPANDSGLEEQIETALQTLDESDRQLLESFYFDGLSQKDLATRLGATPKAISSRLERARARLRERLKLSHET